MLDGAFDETKLNITEPAKPKETISMPQVKLGSGWSYGALKGYADTKDILDSNGNVNLEGLYGAPEKNLLQVEGALTN